MEEVPEASVKRFILDEDEILLARFRGQYYALDAKCTHREGLLSEGTLEDGATLVYGTLAQFNLTTGQAMSPPPHHDL